MDSRGSVNQIVIFGVGFLAVAIVGSIIMISLESESTPESPEVLAAEKLSSMQDWSDSAAVASLCEEAGRWRLEEPSVKEQCAIAHFKVARQAIESGDLKEARRAFDLANKMEEAPAEERETVKVALKKAHLALAKDQFKAGNLANAQTALDLARLEGASTSEIEVIKSTQLEKSSTSTKKTLSTESPSLGKQARILTSKDISIKALTKPLSTYHGTELKAMPMNIRKEYRIILPSDISKEELKGSMKQLVRDETTKNPDIDEIVIFAYDRENDSEGIYTLGKMMWCPNGNWAGVTPNIASSNDRSSYEYVFDIKPKVGSLSAKDIPTKQECAIYDTYMKALWDNLDVDEEITTKRVARQLGISEQNLHDIWLKVEIYKSK